MFYTKWNKILQKVGWLEQQN